MQVLRVVAQLLARPASHDIAELCELRNMLLSGSMHHNLVFIDSRQIWDNGRTVNPSYISYGTGFYSDFGRPVTVTSSGKSITFWPDEWQKFIGYEKAVGHFIQYFDANQVWIEGQVKSYNKDSGLYTLVKRSGDDSDREEIVTDVNIAGRPHVWIDSSKKMSSSVSQVGSKLAFSAGDVGKFVRIWWSRYNRYYYGRVTGFDAAARTHTVTYEDKDSRVYDMTSKDYEIIEAPASVLKQAVNVSDALASQVVAEWHRTKGTIMAPQEQGGQDSLPSDVSVAVNSVENMVLRPSPVAAFNISIHLITLINDYFREGGAENMFLSLADSSQSPPGLRVILSHLQFVYQLKSFIGPKKFRNLTWELKESIPFAVSRFEEAHFKDFNLREYNDLQNLLKDIVTIVCNEANESLGNDLLESLDYLRLTLSLKLLSTSKVQKRYLGLSIIKDFIEFVNPKVSQYVLKRYDLLGNSKTNNARTGIQQGNRVQYRVALSINQFDKWLQSSNLMETLFGDSFHQDLVSRADVVFVYMAHRRLLAERHLDLLWQATKGAHEAVVRALNLLILVMIPSLDLPRRMHLFNLLSSVGRKDYSEQFIDLVTVFTIQAVRAAKEEEQRINQQVDNRANIPGPTNDAKKDEKSKGGSSVGRKGQIVNAPQKQYFGFRLLWQFIQDPTDEVEPLSYNDDLCQKALQSLVDLLKEEFLEEREAVMQSCIENIEMGVSVPVSLSLLRRILLLYPTPTKSWFVLSRHAVPKGTTIVQQLDKMIKHHRLLEVIFTELEKYHLKESLDKNQLRSKPELTFGTQTRTLRLGGMEKNKGRGVVERLDFLQFLLSRSLVKLSEQQTFLLWRVFGESVNSAEALDKLCLWLDALVVGESKQVGDILSGLAQEIDPLSESQEKDTSMLKFLSSRDSSLVYAESERAGPDDLQSASILEESVLISFFDNCVLPWAYKEDKITQLSQATTASLFFKLFFYVNIAKKSIKIDVDRSWQRTGALLGLPLIWRIAMDSTNADVSFAAIKVLVEVHHRSGQKHQKAQDSVRGKFIQLCFKQLYFCVQNLSGEEGSSDRSKGKAVAEGAIGDTTVGGPTSPPDEWFESNRVTLTKETSCRRISRLLIALRSFLYRFHYTPSYNIKIKIFSKNEDLPIFSFTIPSHEQFRMVRQKVASFFKEEESMIHLFLKEEGDKLDRNDALLSQMKFGLEVGLVVRKGESSPVQNANKAVQAELPDLILPDSLEKNFSFTPNPLEWVGVANSNEGEAVNDRHLSSVGQYPIKSLHERLISPGKGRYDLFEQNELVMEFLIPILRTAPQYVDQLLEMLDGFLPAESMLKMAGMSMSVYIWDVLQVLPFNVRLVQQIQTIASENEKSQLKQIFDIHSPYRLLYSLQILDSYFDSNSIHGYRLVPFPSQQKLTDWIVKFLQIGGLEHMIQLLTQCVEIMEKEEANDELCDEYSMGRSDLFYSLCGILMRLINESLQLDFSYRMWLSNSSVLPNAQVDVLRSKIAPGLFLSFLDVTNTILHVKRAMQVTFRRNTDGFASDWSAQIVISNGLSLVFGLLAASDDGLSSLKNSGMLDFALHSFAIVCPTRDIRLTTVRVIFLSALSLYLKCVDRGVRHEQKLPRLRLLDDINKSVSLCASGINAPQIGYDNSGKPDALYNLVAALEFLRSQPQLIVKDLANQQSALDWTGFGSSEESSSSAEDFDHFRTSTISSLLQNLRRHSSSESFHSNEPDEVLVGLLRMLLAFISEKVDVPPLISDRGRQTLDAFDVVEFLFRSCLFPRSKTAVDGFHEVSESPLCQSDKSRHLAFLILFRLCESDPSYFLKLASAISPLDLGAVSSNKFRKRTTLWEYDPSALLKSPEEYLGLKNQGGTCYMNSFIQQLYHIRHFRDELLQISQYAENSEYSDVLFQLQVMFGYMKLSQKKYYDTLPFCRSLIDYDGQPISLSEQKDINEFAGMLFDKLEKTSDCADILNSSIRGTLVWKTESLETPYKSEREETFYMITLEVKDKKSIEDSLELSTAEELFTGENKIEDSVIGKKVDATRRSAIRVLPPTLIVQLKRFEFDLETMNRKKLNDYMSFPMELDMFPYTEEGVASKESDKDSDADQEDPIQQDQEDLRDSLDKTEKYQTFTKPTRKPDSYYQYVLTGIVAHVGAIDRGHYYSFIKDRQGQSWHEFNDRMVLPFSPELIPKECFGGFDEVHNPHTGSTFQKYRENNAYLLVYERKEISEERRAVVSPTTSTLRLDAMGEMAEQSASDETSPVMDTCVKSPKTMVASKSTKISEKVLQKILFENAEFQSDRFLFSSEYFSFFWQMSRCKALSLLCEGSTSSEDRSRNGLSSWTLGCLHFLVDVAIKARAKTFVISLLERFEEIILADKSTCCAKSVLEFFSSVSVLNNDQVVVETKNRLNRASSADFVDDAATTTSDERLNSSLVTVFVDCPHGNSTKSFARLLVSAINRLSNSLQEESESGLFKYLLPSPQNALDDHQINKADGVPPKASSQALKWLQSLPDGSTISSVANISNQLLLLIEALSPDEIYRKDGNFHGLQVCSIFFVSNVNFLLRIQVRLSSFTPNCIDGSFRAIYSCEAQCHRKVCFLL